MRLRQLIVIFVHFIIICVPVTFVYSPLSGDFRFYHTARKPIVILRNLYIMHDNKAKNKLSLEVFKLKTDTRKEHHTIHIHEDVKRILNQIITRLEKLSNYFIRESFISNHVTAWNYKHKTLWVYLAFPFSETCP